MLKQFDFLSNFYYHENLCDLVPYNGFDILMFSNNFEKQLIMNNNLNDAKINPLIFNTPELHSCVKNPAACNYLPHMIYINNYKVKNSSVSFMSKDFINLQCETLYLRRINHLTFENLPKNLNKLVLLELTFDGFDTLIKDNKIKIIDIFKCNVNNLNFFKDYSKQITINLYQTKPTVYNKALFGSNITINES